MPLISNGEFVADGWRRLEDGEPLPRGGDVILPLERLLAEGERLADRAGRTGAALPNSLDVAEIAALLPHLALIVLHFPAFTDGRAYSQARLLRTTLAYAGELRASGDVLADQAAFMVRVGFDSFEVSGRQPLQTWRAALRAMPLAYQAGYGGKPPFVGRPSRTGSVRRPNGPRGQL